MNCKNCQYELQPNTKFCSNCGTALTEDVPHFEEAIPTIVNTPPVFASDASDHTPDNHLEEQPQKMSLDPISPPSPTDGMEDAEQFSQSEPKQSKEAPSQNTMDFIDLAVASEMEREPVRFEEPPLYIPDTRRSKAPIVIALLLVAAILGAAFLFFTGTISLPNFSKQPLLSLANGKKIASFDMPQSELEETLGAAISENKGKSLYDDGISIIYRDGRAAQIQLKSGASKGWKTAGKISIGDSRSDIFSAYGTDNLISVAETMGRLDDPSKISQLDEYLIPYQEFEDGIGQINTLNRENYENNPDSYYWVAIHVDSDGIVDNISIGDSSGVFYHK